MNLSLLEYAVYLGSNLFKLYMISMFLNGFLDKKATYKKTLRITYCLYYLVKSVAFVWFSILPSSTFLMDCIFVFLLTCTYSVKWRYRGLATILFGAIQIICIDLCNHLVVVADMKELIIEGLFFSDLLFAAVILLINEMVKFKNHIEVPLFEWILVIGVPMICILISSKVLVNQENHAIAIAEELGLITIVALIYILFDRTEAGMQAKKNNESLNELNAAYEHEIKLLKESEDRIRAFRHDVNNHAIVLKEIARRNNCDEMEDYLDRIAPQINNEMKYSDSRNYVVDCLIDIKLKCSVQKLKLRCILLKM